jgi:hypothetical protein
MSSVPPPLWGLLNKSSSLAATLGVTKSTTFAMNFGHSGVLLKFHLYVQQTHRGTLTKGEGSVRSTSSLR